jgi:LuxR family maltose regulon positive regulatory protein
LLDDSGQYPIVWITGLAGSGKTTLAASYLEARQIPCIWYQIDEGDEDPASFFYYLGLAAKKAAGFGQK